MAEQQLNLYAAYRWLPAFHELDAERRKAVKSQLAGALAPLATSTHFYTLFPTTAEADFVVWSAMEAPELGQPAAFFTSYSTAMTDHRRWVEPTRILWGFTRPSVYARGKTEQDIDPFEGERARYLVVYPFSKTTDWYLKSMDARQGMMNEHIKLGKQYPDVKQLLLYSFGLQDQEFVVSYETEDLVLFSKLVQELRATDARAFTARDTPILTGVYRSTEEFVG